MRRLGLTLAAFLFVAPGLAHGAGKKPAKKKAAAKSAETQSDGDSGAADGAAAPGSASVRQSKKIGAGLLVPVLSDFVLQYGVTGFYNMTPSLQLGFDFLTGSRDIASDFSPSSTIEVTEASLQGMAAFGFGRYFFGNSFNVMAGLGIRTASAALTVEDVSTKQFVKTSTKISSFVLPIAIGNHWSFDGGFTLGCDWLTAMVPLSGGATTESETNISDPDIEEIFTDFQDMADGLAQTTSLTLVLTTIGWQF